MQAKDTCIFTPSSSHSYFGASERGGGWGTLLSPTVISADFLVPLASVSPPWSVGARAEMFIEQSEGFRRGRSEIWAAVQPLTCHTQSLRLFRLLVQTWQRFTHTRCVHTALQEPSGKPVMLTASPPQKIFRDVAEGSFFFIIIFGKPQQHCHGATETSLQGGRQSPTCTCTGSCMAYVGWCTALAQLAVSSSAGCSCVGLGLRSVCRSNGTVAATGILALCVRIRHCRAAGEHTGG